MYDFLMGILIFYFVANALINLYLGNTMSQHWRNVKENGLKIKHILFLLFFLPSTIFLFIVFILIGIIVLIGELKLAKRIRNLLNKVIWIDKKSQ